MTGVKAAKWRPIFAKGGWWTAPAASGRRRRGRFSVWNADINIAPISIDDASILAVRSHRGTKDVPHGVIEGNGKGQEAGETI